MSTTTTTTMTSSVDTLGSSIQGATFTNPDTKITHQYTIGENVILIGQALSDSEKENLVPIGKIVQLSTEGEEKEKNIIVKIKFFKQGTTSTEGGIGIPYGMGSYAIEGNIRPLPFYDTTESYNTLTSNISSLVCKMININDPSECPSCDPTGELFQEKDFFATKENVLTQLTNNVPQGVGSIGYTTFRCPDQINRLGEISGQPSNKNCNPVVISVTREANNTFRYSLISTITEKIIQSGFLTTYGLPLSLTFYQSIPWSQISDYNTILQNLQGQRIVCKDLDNYLLDTIIENLLQKGYIITFV